MRTITITVQNLPEHLYLTIWDAVTQFAPKKYAPVPTDNVELNYAHAPEAARRQILEALTQLSAMDIVVNQDPRR